MRFLTRPLAITVILAGGACSKKSSPPEDSGTVPASAAPTATAITLTLTPSDVAVARTVSLTDAITISGPLEPAQTIAIKAQINGTVQSIRVDRGSPVRRGQVLVEIDAQGIRGQAASARAQIAAADANVVLAKERVESARKLEAAGAVSSNSRKSAEAALQAAEAQAEAARAMAAGATEAASHATVVSPIDGVVSDRVVEQGEAVKDGGILLTVVETSMLELRANVGVDEAMRVKPGQAVMFSLDAVPGESFRGRIARVDPRADPATRQVGVSSQLPNPGGRIVAGQFARGRVLTGAPTPQVVVPLTAITDSSGHSSLFLIDKNRLVRREVILGVRDEAQGLVAIKSGLSAGDRVLGVPVLGAAEGLTVSMASDSAAARKPK